MSFDTRDKRNLKQASNRGEDFSADPIWILVALILFFIVL